MSLLNIYVDNLLYSGDVGHMVGGVVGGVVGVVAILLIAVIIIVTIAVFLVSCLCLLKTTYN